MVLYSCRHTCHPVAPDLRLIGFAAGPLVVTALLRSGDCHDAAYLAQKAALRLARASGYRNVVIRSTSALVTNQLRGIWRARKTRTKRHLAECRRLAAGMNVTYV